MNSFEELVSRKWILRSKDEKLYLEVKDSIKEIKKIVMDKFGYTVIVTPYLIKLEKIPGKSEPWMGIQEFQSIEEYQMFCATLMFLEEKGREEQFILSALTEYIQMQFKEGTLDWTNYASRRQLVRVIKYCVQAGLIVQDDGNEDQFLKDIGNEVLYENTGNSRYILRNFIQDILDFNKPTDFEQSDWIDMEQDRGIVRRQRVYRRLLLSCGVYRNQKNDEDFQYIRMYRNQIEKDFQKLFPCDLHVHKSSAFLALAPESQMGALFPTNNTISDLILLVCDSIQKKVKKKTIELDNQERIVYEKTKFESFVSKTIQRILKNCPKKYQELGADAVGSMVIQAMLTNGFIQVDSSQYILFPVCGKIAGNYA